MTLRYPLEVGSHFGTDYVTFTPSEYRPNNSELFGQGAATAPGPANVLNSVILYMPESTPSISNVNNWGGSGEEFAGPAGALVADVGSQLVNTGFDTAGGMLEPSEIVERIDKALASGAEGLGGAAGQKLLEGGAQMVGTTANSLLAVSRGQVYNPNLELLYKSPAFREFQFEFTFVPKSAKEAQNVNAIIKHFKKWAAPGDAGTMFEVPYVWQVQYMTGASQNMNMNQFKKAALKSVGVVDNPQTVMHSAHEDGVPTSTSINLAFMEVDILTRQDHESVAGGNRGF